MKLSKRLAIVLSAVALMACANHDKAAAKTGTEKTALVASNDAPKTAENSTEAPVADAGAIAYVPANSTVSVESKDGKRSFYLKGELPNSCYELRDVRVAKSEALAHTIEVMVHVKPGMCMMMIKPVMARIPLDAPATGTHTFTLKGTNGAKDVVLKAKL